MPFRATRLEGRPCDDVCLVGGPGGAPGVGAAPARVPDRPGEAPVGSVRQRRSARWAAVLSSDDHRSLRQVLLVLFSLADAVSKAFSWGWDAMTVLYLAPSLVAVLAVAVRRRWPLVALLVSLPSLFLSGLQIAPTILLANHTYRRPTFPLALTTAITLGMTVAGSVLFRYPGQGWALVDLQSAVYFAGFIGGASLLGQLLKVRLEQRGRLLALQASRHREHLLVERAARADERDHLAREMHDVVSHQVSLIAIQAGALRVTTGLPGHVHETAETIRTLAVRANEELRQVLGALRDEDVAASLDAQHTICDIAHLWVTTGVRGRLDLPDRAATAAVSPPVQRAVYRIAQEALTNVRKHAGGSSVHLVVTAPAASCVELSVVNSAVPHGAGGAGTGPLAGGSGLVGISERARSLGGTLSAGPVPGGGFAVTATFPVSGRRTA